MCIGNKWRSFEKELEDLKEERMVLRMRESELRAQALRLAQKAEEARQEIERYRKRLAVLLAQTEGMEEEREALRKQAAAAKKIVQGVNEDIKAHLSPEELEVFKRVLERLKKDYSRK